MTSNDSGSLVSTLFLRFQVVFTKGPNLQLKVHAEVVHPKTGAHDTTNIFHFTFTTDEGVDVPNVMPKTYAGNFKQADVVDSNETCRSPFSSWKVNHRWHTWLCHFAHTLVRCGFVLPWSISDEIVASFRLHVVHRRKATLRGVNGHLRADPGFLVCRTPHTQLRFASKSKDCGNRFIARQCYVLCLCDEYCILCKMVDKTRTIKNSVSVFCCQEKRSCSPMCVPRTLPLCVRCNPSYQSRQSVRM